LADSVSSTANTRYTNKGNNKMNDNDEMNDNENGKVNVTETEYTYSRLGAVNT
jgi:hypothetical protein